MVRAWIARLGSALALCGAVGAADAQILLYDPFLGTPPTSQGWLQGTGGTAGSTVMEQDAFRLDTMSDDGIQHGFSRFSPVPLDWTNGFQFTFNLRVDGDRSQSVNRAGFSLILVGNNPSQSLEIAFRGSEVFMYEYVPGDPDRFVHGSGIAYNVGMPLTGVLTVADGAFTLNLGQQSFGGTLQNYTADGAPYTVPNLIFFGDDTTRAGANVLMGHLAISAVPEAPSGWMLLAGLLTIAAWCGLRRRRR